MSITPIFILEDATGAWHRPQVNPSAQRPCTEAALCGEMVIAVALAFDECRAVDLRCYHCEEIFEGRPRA
jgi:hypothetical protein